MLIKRGTSLVRYLFIKLFFLFLLFGVILSSLFGCRLSDNAIRGQIGEQLPSENPDSENPNEPPHLDLANSTFESLRNWTGPGISNQYTFKSKDQYGNLFYDPTLNVSFDYSGGTSKGWLDSVVDNGDGTYLVKFVGRTNGTPTNVNPIINSQTYFNLSQSIEVKTPRLNFTGNSMKTAPISSRSFNEIDGKFTFTGDCDVELGKVKVWAGVNGQIQGLSSTSSSNTNLEIDCNPAGGGSFSLDIFYDNSSPANYVYSGVGAVFLGVSQGEMKPIETWVYKYLSSKPIGIINTFADMEAMVCNDTDRLYVLNNDIDVSIEKGSSVNNFSPLCNPFFQGSFDGNGHTISNLHRTTGLVNYSGLFKDQFSNQNGITNITIQNIVISSTGISIGGLAGRSTGYVKNINVINGIISSTSYEIGGILGDSSGPITNISFSGNVTTTINGTARAGGIVGGGFASTVSFASSSGNIYASTGVYVGGICGSCGTVKFSKSDMTIDGSNNVSGISSGFGTYSNNMFNGAVYGFLNVSGIAPSIVDNAIVTGTVVGYTSTAAFLSSNTTFNSFNTGFYLDSATCTNCDNNNTNHAKNDSELKQQSTFSGLNFYKFWTIDEGVSYPDLQ